MDTRPTEGDVTIVNLAFRTIVAPSFEETSITVEFDEIYLINELKLEGQHARGVAVQPGKTGVPFCYVVDVSKDEFQWIRVVDYSYLRCYSTQQLYFPKQAVRYVSVSFCQHCTVCVVAALMMCGQIECYFTPHLPLY